MPNRYPLKTKDMKKILTPRFMAEAGIIAALYFALTMASIPLSYMTPQVRISEALCVLPFFTPAAIPRAVYRLCNVQPGGQSVGALRYCVWLSRFAGCRHYGALHSAQMACPASGCGG
jgi:hypothetical protein